MIVKMAKTPRTDPMTVPAIAPPLIDFCITGTGAAELLAARPVPVVELASTVGDVLAVEVVDGS